MLCFASSRNLAREPASLRNPAGEPGASGIFKGKAKPRGRRHRAAGRGRGPEATWASRGSGRRCFGTQLEPLLGKPNWGKTQNPKLIPKLDITLLILGPNQLIPISSISRIWENEENPFSSISRIWEIRKIRFPVFPGYEKIIKIKFPSISRIGLN